MTLGLASFTVSLIPITFATQAWLLYAGAILSLFQATIIPIVASYTASLIERNEMRSLRLQIK